MLIRVNTLIEGENMIEIEKYIKDNILKVLIKPNSPKNQILGFDENKKALRISIKAVPEKGKANQELVKFISKLLKKKVEIIKGLKSREKIESQKAVDIIEKEIETLPLTDAECPKCSHKKAFFWTIQTRAADEPETRFYKCEKCKHIWREYD